jgi:hypothetical protein
MAYINHMALNKMLLYNEQLEIIIQLAMRKEK